MKKIFSILFAGLLALAAVSCVTEKPAIFDHNMATAPVVGSASVTADGISVQFTPAVAGQEFGTTPMNHWLILDAVNGTEVGKNLNSSVKDNVLTVSNSTLKKALGELGFNEGATVSLEMTLRASLQDPSKDNGINGYIDAETPIKLNYEIPASGGGDPYAGWEKSTWGVTGAIASVDINWNADIEMYTDGTWHVAKSVVLSASDQFKFRKDGGWDVNFGAGPDITEEPYVVTLNAELPAGAGGKNLAVAANGTYDLLLNPEAELYKVIESGAGGSSLPDIDLSQYDYLDIMEGAETWGIIGPAVSDWSVDVDLEKVSDDPEVWAAKGVPFNADSFKFRGNDTWADYDLGGGEFALNTPIVMTKGGGDMTAEAGNYDVYLYPTYGVAYITTGGGDTPPPPAKPTLWSLIGTLNGTSWDNDFDMEKVSGDIWKIRNVAITEADEFKIRAEHDWGKSVGGPEENDVSIIDSSNPYGVYKPELGVAFAAGDKNIRVGVEGSYDVTYDYAAQTILIEEYKEYPETMYMIGEAIGGWDWGADYIVDMIPVINNQWGGDATGQFYAIRWLPAGKGFKFCSQKAWSGDFWGLEENDGFVEDGGNCTVEADGIYMIHIDLKNSKVHVEPARVYGIGDCAGGKWDENLEEVLYQADGKSLKLTLANSGSVRAYVASAIATSSWWTREFAVIDGQIVYRTGDELAWPQGSKDQVVTFNFNEGTGSISGEAAPPEPYGLIGWHANDSWSTNVELIDVDGQPNWKVAKYIGARDGNIDFKFRRGTAWTPQIGATYKNPKELNTLFSLTEKTEGSEPDPANIHLNGDGVYDVYLNEKELQGFILEAGTAFAVPTTWESTETPKMSWFIIGEAVGGWDTANDIPFEDVEGAWYKASNVTFAGNKNFKFRADHAWTYQLTCPGMRTPGEVFNLEDGNGSNNDMQVPYDGIYNVYLAKDLQTALVELVGQSGGSQVLFLNEFDTQNKKIEIYNASDSEIDMTGWTLSKDETVWTIPAEHAKVPAKGYIVYTGKSDGTTDPTFGLSGTKGFIVVLADKDGKEIDKVDNSSAREGGIVKIEDGKSWGRKTDGADEFVIFDTPTIGAPNGAAQGGSASIKLDGDMSDWEGLQAYENSGSIKEWKYASDAENVYFYYKLDAHDIKDKDGSYNWRRYMYVALDTDNNAATGLVENMPAGLTMTGSEAIAAVYPFRGTVPAGQSYPAGVEFVNGVDEQGFVQCPANGESNGFVSAFGYVDGDYGYLEIGFSKAAIGSPAPGKWNVQHSFSWNLTEATVIDMK